MSYQQAIEVEAEIGRACKFVAVLDLAKAFDSVCRVKLTKKKIENLEVNTANESNSFLTPLTVTTIGDMKNY